MGLLNVARVVLIIVLVCQCSARKIPRQRHVRNIEDNEPRFIGLGGLTGGNNIAGLGGNNGGAFPGFGNLGNAWQNLLSTFTAGLGQLSPWDFSGKEQCEMLKNKQLNLVRLENGGVYMFSTGLLSWPQADRECKALGMHLVSMETKYENDLVQDFIWNQNYYNTEDDDCTWIGLVDGDGDTTTRDFYWVSNNQPPTYDNWAYDSDYLCGCVYTDEDSPADDVGWDSYDCIDRSSYMCELEGECAKYVDAVDIPYVARKK